MDYQEDFVYSRYFVGPGKWSRTPWGGGFGGVRFGCLESKNDEIICFIEIGYLCLWSVWDWP